MRSIGSSAGCTLLAAALLLAGCDGPAARAPGATEVLALEYGTSVFDEHYLIEGGRRQAVPFSWYTFLVRSDARRILVDSGFVSPGLARRFGVTLRGSVDEMLAQVGVAPDEVTDLVVTHGHWDHAGGIGRFPRATVWISETELELMRSGVSEERPWNGGYRFEDLAGIRAVRESGRLRLVRGPTSITQGVRLVPTGGHTPGMLSVVVSAEGAPRLVLAGDNAYLYRNLEQRRPISQAARAAGASDALPAIRALAGERAAIVPGHDPEIARRFERVAPGIARILPRAPPSPD
jgi:glyoxylase-like metal-dependent hydrolase (beta-lactamase superfamily II)